MSDMSLWFLVLAGLLVGALVGAAGALIALRRGEGGAAASRRELDAYRDEVASHYAETARRVDALTHAYKAVYDHLEEGAYRLVGEDELKRRLDDASRDPVTLEGIGRRALDAGEDANEDANDAATPAGATTATPSRAIPASGAASVGAAATPADDADEAAADASADPAADAASERPDDADAQAEARASDAEPTAADADAADADPDDPAADRRSA
jgi:uncharacterized membrane-anchored protein YhcB (DUF1043 family)